MQQRPPLPCSSHSPRPPAALPPRQLPSQLLQQPHCPQAQQVPPKAPPAQVAQVVQHAPAHCQGASLGASALLHLQGVHAQGIEEAGQAPRGHHKQGAQVVLPAQAQKRGQCAHCHVCHAPLPHLHAGQEEAGQQALGSAMAGSGIGQALRSLASASAGGAGGGGGAGSSSSSSSSSSREGAGRGAKVQGEARTAAAAPALLLLPLLPLLHSLASALQGILQQAQRAVQHLHVSLEGLAVQDGEHVLQHWAGLAAIVPLAAHAKQGAHVLHCSVARQQGLLPQAASSAARAAARAAAAASAAAGCQLAHHARQGRQHSAHCQVTGGNAPAQAGCQVGEHGQRERVAQRQAGAPSQAAADDASAQAARPGAMGAQRLKGQQQGALLQGLPPPRPHQAALRKQRVQQGVHAGGASAACCRRSGQLAAHHIQQARQQAHQQGALCCLQLLGLREGPARQGLRQGGKELHCVLGVVGVGEAGRVGAQGGVSEGWQGHNGQALRARAGQVLGKLCAVQQQAAQGRQELCKGLPAAQQAGVGRQLHWHARQLSGGVVPVHAIGRCCCWGLLLLTGRAAQAAGAGAGAAGAAAPIRQQHVAQAPRVGPDKLLIAWQGAAQARDGIGCAPPAAHWARGVLPHLQAL